MILRCTCSHEAQDSLHGKGNRVANRTKQTNPDKYRCTVCSALITVYGAVETKGKEKK